MFTAGNDSVPLALMGLNEGVNTYVDDEGKLVENVYVPAYARRYPFILARLQQGSDEPSLCFDPTAGVLGAHAEGQDLFTQTGEPSDYITGGLDLRSEERHEG